MILGFGGRREAGLWFLFWGRAVLGVLSTLSGLLLLLHSGFGL